MSLTNLNAAPPQPVLPVTGAAMDQRIAKPRRNWALLIGAAILATGVLAYGVYLTVPRGLVVRAADLSVAGVESGMFRDDITMRATAQALNSIVLDAADRGRVEEVFVRDGAIVEARQPLFRLSNPQRRMDLLQRQSEQAQQISNLSSFNVSADAARSDSLRRLAMLEFNLNEARKQQQRNEQLVAQGFMSRAAFQDGSDKLAKMQRELQEEREIDARGSATRREAIRSLERAVAGMRSGLQLFDASIDALTVRAPVAGRLTDFNLQVGEAVKADQRVGRIDEPNSFKLAAQVDEYYLPRIALGHRGKARIGGTDYAVVVKTIFAQVKDGRFLVDLVFSDAKPQGLRPGMSVDLSVTLGEPVPALTLPNGAFLNDSGGAWVFVLDKAGHRAERRPIKLGRRNNAQVEVLAGLAPGERVIVSGYQAFGKSEQLKLTR